MAEDASFQELLEELAKVRGLDFRGYKPESLQRRLRKRMAQVNIDSYSDYIRYFGENPSEINNVLEVVLINVTEFFRDPEAWDALRQEALPSMLERLKPGDSFRAWCAGCASGEEVFSLAILLAEHFGPRLSEYDVKIYATDHDEDALNVARRGEYTIEHLRRLRPDWRTKYFDGTGRLLRVQRELRRLAIFGRSNLVTGAPISHVSLLICRNVLIYFDVDLQRQVLEKFRYALEEGGVLFLGRSESQLCQSATFQPVSSKWRIFRCGKAPGLQATREKAAIREDREVESVRLTQRYLLETLRSGVIVLDNNNVVTSINEAALSIWGMGGLRVVGSPLAHGPLAERCPKLADYVEQSAATTEPLRFQYKINLEAEERALELIFRPMLSTDGSRTGTLMFTEDMSPQEKLRSTNEELETAAEELHSANEELETTNEELQSTNEELETTNEELQSTNEELETTNEELHSLNEELETTNDELEQRTHLLEEVTTRYADTLALMPSPLALVNDAAEIQLWNTAAETLFDLNAKGLTGLKLKQLPVASSLRAALLRQHEKVLKSGQASTIQGVKFNLNSFRGTVDVRLMPIPSTAGHGVLIVFNPRRMAREVPPSHNSGTRKRRTRPRGKKSTKPSRRK